MSQGGRTKIAELSQSTPAGSEVTAKGWVRTKRGNKNVAFIALNDGSIIHNIQIVVDVNKFDDELLKRITTGACIRVTGTLVESQGSGQRVEIQAGDIEVYGSADPDTYPLQKKGHSMEFLREIAYLRPRTNTFGAVLRIRHAMAYADPQIFQRQRVLLPAHPADHRQRCRRRRSHVPGDDARPEQRAQRQRRACGLLGGFSSANRAT